MPDTDKICPFMMEHGCACTSYAVQVKERFKCLGEQCIAYNIDTRYATNCLRLQHKGNA